MAVFTVNTTADLMNSLDVVTTLREAIEAANNSPGEDTILFELEPGQQTITLDPTLGTLEITDSVNIVGKDVGISFDISDSDSPNLELGVFKDADQITVQGDGSFDIFTISAENNVSAEPNVTFKSLTISEGVDAIQVNDGNLTVIDSILRNSSDGIESDADNSKITVINSIFADNTDGIDIDGNNTNLEVFRSFFVGHSDD
ncbi:MAG: hypothetical protein F6J98_21330, partial [Moorea sp. SIO4G2]|nr:hypothetical protein [Moorena sp. SIO4G2]